MLPKRTAWLGPCAASLSKQTPFTKCLVAPLREGGRQGSASSVRMQMPAGHTCVMSIMELLVVCSGRRASDRLRGAVRHDQLPGADDLLADCPWCRASTFRFLLNMCKCSTVLHYSFTRAQQAGSHVCPGVWQETIARVVGFHQVWSVAMAGCMLRRYYVRGENSPAVPLAFMAAHTVCSLGEEAALQSDRWSLTADIHEPMRHPDCERLPAASRISCEGCCNWRSDCRMCLAFVT